MRKPQVRTVSPAFVISLFALFVALGGTTYAATSLPRNSVGTAQLKHDAVTKAKIKTGAVTASKINPTGLTVPNADSATHASTAASATHANTSDFATNSSQLGGLLAEAYQQRVTGYCPTAVQLINQGGTVYCSQGTVVPIDIELSDGQDGTGVLPVGALGLEVTCQGGGSVLSFSNSVSSQATLNDFYWDQSGTPTANSTVVLPADAAEVPFTTGPIEGQFILSLPGQEQVTFNLHAIYSSGVCVVAGTADYGRE